MKPPNNHKISMITVVLFLLFAPASIMARQPLSIGARLEGTAVVPANEHREGGFGGFGIVENNLIDILSIWAGIGSTGIGGDHGLVHTLDIRDAYREVRDLRIDLGAKLFITNGLLQPYLGMALSYHDIQYAIYHITLDGQLVKKGSGSMERQLGYAPSTGLRAKFSERWAIDISSSINLASDYEYFSFQVGLNCLL